MPAVKDKIDRDGFINCLLENTSQHYLHALEMITKYCGRRPNYEDPSIALECLKENPAFADKITAEIKTYVKRPNIDKNLLSELIRLITILIMHYNSNEQEDKALELQLLTSKIRSDIKKQDESDKIKATEARQQATALAERSKAAIRLRRDLDPDIIAKLTATPPVLPWELNKDYAKGPYRTRVEYNQYDSSTYVTLPLFEQLLSEYPELIRLAQQNPERLPRDEAIIKRKIVAWQQQLLRDDRAFRSMPAEVKAKLLESTPMLPWVLNLQNTQAPGFESESNMFNTYTYIPLRSKLIDKYPDLIEAADRNPEPGMTVLQQATARAENYKAAIRLRRDLDPDIIAKLTATPPVLPWELNKDYAKGPYRTDVMYDLYGSPTTVILPLFEQLLSEYPELIQLAQQNPERLPRDEAIIKRKIVAWQQQLLRDDRAFRSMPAEVKAKLLESTPILPWALNLQNTQAPGFASEMHRNERYTYIPLRSQLIDKYPDLIEAADRNPEPGVPIIHTERRTARAQVIAPTREPIRAAHTTSRSAAAATAYKDIEELITSKKYDDIIDHIELKGMYRSLTCPLSLCLMRDPVILGDTGKVFERSQIQKALRDRPNKNPLDNTTITNTNLVPAYMVRDMIEEFLKSDELRIMVEKYKESPNKRNRRI